MRGFKLTTVADANNPIEGDLHLDGGAVVEVDGDEATAQEIRTRLLFFKGECFADVREGVPYYQEILRKAPDLTRVRSIIRRVILSVPAVVDVPRIDIDIDRATRVATINWTARTDTGRLIRSEDFGPLIIGER